MHFSNRFGPSSIFARVHAACRKSRKPFPKKNRFKLILIHIILQRNVTMHNKYGVKLTLHDDRKKKRQQGQLHYNYY